MVRIYSLLTRLFERVFFYKKHNEKIMADNGILGFLGNLLGLGITATENEINRRYASNENAKARRENYRYNEMAADNAMERTIKLWNDYQSPEAMARQYSAAGLNKGLMYGSSGASGRMISGPQGGSGGGMITPTLYNLGGYASEAALRAAQIRNIDADTAKKTGETNLQTTQQKVMEAETRLKQALENKAWSEAAYTDWKSNLDAYRLEIEKAKSEAEINEINTSIEIMEENMIKIREEIKNIKADTTGKQINNKYLDEQITENIKAIKMAQEEAKSRIILNQAKDRLTDEQAQFISRQIMQFNREMINYDEKFENEQEYKKALTEWMNAKAITEYWNSINGSVHELSYAVDTFCGVGGKGLIKNIASKMKKKPKEQPKEKTMNMDDYLDSMTDEEKANSYLYKMLRGGK